ncbi:Zinc finger protein [Vigna angularis]|uniref:Zinc finger protein n=1 Tax=Phaseolus angularis TaxID=3914 RepID=A0A8T0KEQ8_PHAAN|nr:Zinc finger protein [Vigna angularis]
MASNLSSSMVTPRLHQCSICGLVFGLGQALGGHMRKHRVSSNDALSTIHDRDLPESNVIKKLRLWLDLNLTPYENYLTLNSMTPVLHLFL